MCLTLLPELSEGPKTLLCRSTAVVRILKAHYKG